jgi:hypothetical protein
MEARGTAVGFWECRETETVGDEVVVVDEMREEIGRPVLAIALVVLVPVLVLVVLVLETGARI